MDKRPDKKIELKQAEHPDEGYSHELHFISATRTGDATTVERLNRADLDLLRKVISSPVQGSPDGMLSDGDHISARLGPNAYLVTDKSTRIVLVTPDRRITVDNVDHWREGLGLAQTHAQACWEAEQVRRAESRAAGHMYAGHTTSLRDRDDLIGHLHLSPGHGDNISDQLARLENMSTADLFRAHERKHGLP